MLTQRDAPFTASMLRDLQAGRRTEHRHILGDLLERGQGHGLSLPILALAFSQMEMREQASDGPR